MNHTSTEETDTLLAKAGGKGVELSYYMKSLVGDRDNTNSQRSMPQQWQFVMEDSLYRGWKLQGLNSW